MIDAMVGVQSINLKGRNIETCKDFAKELVQRCRMLAAGSQNVRLVFYTYREKSLKESTRNLRRGKVAHLKLKYRIEDSTKIKGTLKQFLAHMRPTVTLSHTLPRRLEEHFKMKMYLVLHDFSTQCRRMEKTQGNIEPHNLSSRRRRYAHRPARH